MQVHSCLKLYILYRSFQAYTAALKPQSAVPPVTSSCPAGSKREAGAHSVSDVGNHLASVSKYEQFVMMSDG